MAASQSIASLLDINLTLGSVFIGHIAVDVFFGITSIQAYIYFRDHAKDSLLLKASVLILWIMDALHFVFICQGIYFQGVTEYGQVLSLLILHWTWIAQYFVGSCVNAFVRMVYCVWLCRDTKYPKLIFATFSPIILLALGFSTVVFVKLLKVSTVATFQIQSKWMLAALGSMLACEVVLAVCQTYKLLSRRKELFQNCSTVDIMMACLVNSTIISTLCTMLILITYTIMPTKLVWIIFHLVQPELCINALLAMLNTRPSPQQTRVIFIDASLPSSRFHIQQDQYSVGITQEK